MAMFRCACLRFASVTPLLRRYEAKVGPFPSRTFASKNLRANSADVPKDRENLQEAPPPFDGSLKLLAGEFPEPRGALQNLLLSVASELKVPSYKLIISFKPIGTKSLTWSCTCHLTWPSTNAFSAVAKTKREASKQASLKALQWLTLQGKLRNNKPVIVDEATKKALKKTDIEIVLNENDVSAIEAVLSVYEHEVKDAITRASESAVKCAIKVEEEGEVSRISESKKQNMINNRNRLLKERDMLLQESEAMTNREKLPIFKFREDILNAVNENQVVIIKGEPGCGKSTQVPQYILEEAVRSGHACDCNIIVTQPRRISAISLAERVAWERDEQVGDVLGFQVRFHARHPRPPGASIRFCSSGILLRMLQSNPNLNGVSHVILDEAHERDVNTDMLMLLLKRLLVERPDIKLMVMSATINPELFQNYYRGAQALSIPGFTFPVNAHFLEDITAVNLNQTRGALDQQSPRIFHDEIANVIKWINDRKPEGAVLCFLPGWQDIKGVQTQLQRILRSRTCWILPLHSRLTNEDQRRVFKNPPPGIRKIILSTNIAETSVTIDDVVYVVDTGIHKEERLTADKEMSVLDNDWVSKANVSQRKGRAGRVQPGESFHLYTKHKFESLPRFPLPELLRVPLQKVVLDVKTHNEKEKVSEFLSSLPEPPSSEASEFAVKDLVYLGALTPEETLTALGRRIAKFSTHPKLSKALVHAAIYRCLDPILTITSILSAEADMFSNSLEERSEIVSIKRQYHTCSDHLAALGLFDKWHKIFSSRDEQEEEMFCIRNMLRSSTMRLINRVRNLSLEHLAESKLVQERPHWSEDLDESKEDLPISPQLVSAVLFSGLSTYMFRRNWDVQSGRLRLNKPSFITENGTKALLASDSVCHKQSQLTSPFLTYFRRQESAIRRASVVRDAGVVSPIAFALFSPKSSLPQVKDSRLSDISKSLSETTVMDNQLRMPFRIIASDRDADLLLKLKVTLNNVTEYFLEHEGLTVVNKDYDVISQFREVLIVTISDLLERSMHKANYRENVVVERKNLDKPR